MNTLDVCYYLGTTAGPAGGGITHDGVIFVVVVVAVVLCPSAPPIYVIWGYLSIYYISGNNQSSKYLFS